MKRIIHCFFKQRKAVLDIADGDYGVKPFFSFKIYHFVNLVFVICSGNPAGAESVINALQNNTFAVKATVLTRFLRILAANGNH